MAAEHKHHILEEKICWKVGGMLLILTALTVILSRFHFGMFNFPIAMLVATVKASLVVLFFMGLKNDDVENSVIFGTSFVFLGIYIVLTCADVFTRGSTYGSANGFFKEAAGASKFKEPWKESPEILAHGKTLFAQQCTMCHGETGDGNGPASGGLNPKPRNFTNGAGWIGARRPSNVFEVLTNGVNTMPSFGSLPSEDRWALAHYVLSLGPEAEKDTVASLKAAGVDPSKKGGGEKADQRLPIDFIIDQMATD